ncbi:hypothetical protein Tco_0385983, partial [Tanacetum coccineum]
MTSLADKSLLSGGDNKPPMLEKHLYDSWKSRMELYMMNRPHGRMILASVEKGPLVWPSMYSNQVFHYFVSYFVPPSSLTHAIPEVVLHCLIMVKLSVDLNEPKDSSKTDKAAQNGRTPKSLTLEIHHGGWFTPTPCRSYIGGQVSSVNVVNINEFCLHDLKHMVVKLGYGVEDLMYCHFLIPSFGLDFGLHSLNVDADVLEMSKYVKDYKIMLAYVEHGSSIVDTSMFDSSPDVNRNVRKKWEKVSSKSSSIGEVMKKLIKEQPASFVARPIVVESVVDPFDGLDEILGDYANTRKQITRDESTWKQMVVHIGTSSTADDFSFGRFKEVEVEADTESEEEESDTEGNDTSGSNSEDLDYDTNHDDVFDDDEHIVEEVHVNMNNFSFT